MIKKKFGYWDKFIKNFSMTYIGYGKILYYYRDPRTRKITYGKIDLAIPRTRLVLSTFFLVLITVSVFSYNFFGNPAPATPRDKNEEPPLIQFSSDTELMRKKTKLEKNDTSDYNGFTRLMITETEKILQGDVEDNRTRELLSAADALPDKINGADKNKQVNVEQKETNKNDNKKTDKSSGQETSIDDEATETLKKKFMLSNATEYTPQSEGGKLKIYYYTVKRGDSIGLLARRFGVSPHTIGGASRAITNMDELWPGTKLSIPSKDGILVKMQPGQTIAAVANRYRVPLEKIIRANNFSDPDNIAVGEFIFLPDVKPANLFTGFIWPIVGTITSDYGWRIHPILNRRMFHEGIDLRARYQGIRAAKSGKVVYAGWMGAYGKVVIVAHPGNFKTLYGHNSRLYVRVGQYVRQGQWISLSGNTGRSTGPHLHFEIWKNEQHVHPLKYLKKNKKG